VQQKKRKANIVRTWPLLEQLATISKGRVVVHKRFVCSTEIHSREHSATKCVPSEVLPEVSTWLANPDLAILCQLGVSARDGLLWFSCCTWLLAAWGPCHGALIVQRWTPMHWGYDPTERWLTYLHKITNSRYSAFKVEKLQVWSPVEQAPTWNWILCPVFETRLSSHDGIKLH